MIFKCSFSYGKNKVIFENEEFDFLENKVNAICGHNGAGKTTLLKCAGGIFNQKDSFSSSWFVGAGGALIQHFSLLEHLRLLGKGEEGQPYISLFEIEDVKNKSISRLSTGQKMICSVITALCSDADILLLDEPFGPLDPVNAEKLSSVLKECRKTVIITSHDLYLTSQVADKIFFIKNGRVTFNSLNTKIDSEELMNKYRELA